MKQKRKVKSLLPQRKDRKTSFLTTLLLVLSTILCIGSVSLLTSSVFAADSTVVTFTGLNDNVEVLYNLKFVDPEHLSGDGVADVYVHDNSLYISPSTVIVSVSGSTDKNEVESGVYSHILGGKRNKIHSENVTIIAGDNNLASGGKNSVILGGTNDWLETGAVSIGGNYNQVSSSKEGVVLIGGHENYVIENYTNRNIFILGGENNKINTTGENMIIGGSGVNISGSEINNIFVFSSPKTFTPMGGKAFYLNVDNGVGIGTSGVPGGLAVKGAIGLSNQGDQRFCNSDSIGVIYSLNGCLIGCTKTSLKKQAEVETVDAPFELLSLNERCKDKLLEYINAGNVFYQEEEIPETPSYTGYCIPVGFTGNTRACSTPEVYQNVIFETSIVDQGGCNAINLRSGENKCVFECIDGYHLGYDSTAGTGCYADCELNGKTIKHNQTGTWYNKSMVLCSDGVKCATCAGHAKTLMCKNGNLYYYSGGRIHGKVSDDTNNKLYKECTLYGGYYCERHDYKLSISDLQNLGSLKVRNVGKPIEENLLFSHQKLGFNIEGQLNRITNNKTTTASIRQNEFNWSVVTSSSARGYYQLCKDYNGMWGNTDDIGKAKSSNVDCGTPSYNYKLIGCKTGYTMLDGECQAKCTSFIQGEGIKQYMPGTIITGYKSEWVSCGNECDYAVFECRDEGGSAGVWRRISGGKGTKEIYKYSNCSHTTKGICSGYNIDGKIYNQYDIKNGTKEKTSIYESCQTYKLSNIKSECETGDVMYRLAGCKTGYHTENGLYCISDERIGYCNYNNIPVNSVLSREGGDFEGYMLEQGEYLEKWTTCGWNGVGKDCWTAPYPKYACDRKCNSNAEEVGGKCIVNGKCSKEKFMCDDGYEASEELTGDNNEGYYWKCRGDQVSGSVAECHLCNEDYPSYNETTKKCEKNECYGDEPNNAILLGSDQNLTSRVQRTLYDTPSEATGKPCGYVCDYRANFYKYGDDCERKSSLCGDIPYKCISPLNEANTGETRSEYTWDCYFDGMKMASCSLEKNIVEYTCDYSKDTPSCNWGGTPQDIKELACGYEWKCGTNDCSKYYIFDEEIEYVNGYSGVFVNDFYSDGSTPYCNNNRTIWNSKHYRHVFGTEQDCEREANKYGVIMSPSRPGTQIDRPKTCTVGVDSNCISCVECVPTPNKPNYGELSYIVSGGCYIDKNLSSDNLCSGLKNKCTAIKPTPYKGVEDCNSRNYEYNGFYYCKQYQDMFFDTWNPIRYQFYSQDECETMARSYGISLAGWGGVGQEMNTERCIVGTENCAPCIKCIPASDYDTYKCKDKDYCPNGDNSGDLYDGKCNNSGAGGNDSPSETTITVKAEVTNNTKFNLNGGRIVVSNNNGKTTVSDPSCSVIRTGKTYCTFKIDKNIWMGASISFEATNNNGVTVYPSPNASWNINSIEVNINPKFI